MKSGHRLTIEFSDGAADEYRIRKSNVEFRPRHRSSSLQKPGKWRRLDAEDIALHLALRTPVAEWLTLRMLRRAQGWPSVSPGSGDG
jgi:hypothetical protein